MKNLLELKGVKKMSKEDLKAVNGGEGDMVTITIHCYDGYAMSYVAYVDGSFESISGVNPDFVCYQHLGHKTTSFGVVFG